MNMYFDDLYDDVYEYTYDVITEKKRIKKKRIKWGGVASNPLDRNKLAKNIDKFLSYLTFVIIVYRMAKRLINVAYNKACEVDKYKEIMKQYDNYEKKYNPNGNESNALHEYLSKRIGELNNIKELLSKKEADERKFLYCINLVEKMKRKDISLFKKIGVKKELLDKLNRGWGNYEPGEIKL